MERKFYTNDFERLLKEKSDEFRMYPSKRVWHSIYNDLHPSRKWPSVAMTMMLVIGLLLIGYFNTSDNTSSRPLITDNQASTSKKTGTDQTNKNNPVSHNSKQSKTDFSISTDENDLASSVNSNKGTLSANTDLPDNQDNAFTATANKTSTTVPSNDQNNYNNTTVANNKNVIETMDSYINSNQLLTDVALLNKQSAKTKQVNGTDNNTRSAETKTINSNLPETNNIVAPRNLVAGTALSNVAGKDDKKIDKLTETPAKKANLPLTDKINPNDEKSWMEDYVLHNKSARKKWKDHLEFEIYATPSIGYRKLENNAKPEATVSSFSSNAQQPARDLNKSINQKPGLGLEAGVGLSYSFAKKFRLKVGAQLNYTSYTINADETNHPVLTTLLLNDINTNNSYLTSRTSTHSNSSGLDPVKLRNKTYQVSIPVGLAVKLAGNKKIEWFAGVSIQPTFVMGGKANLISSDYQNYVTEPSMLSKWNLNTGVETYINYKMGSYSIQVGPQLRYQVLSTYNKKYTIKENLYNAGLKVGIVKGF